MLAAIHGQQGAAPVAATVVTTLEFELGRLWPTQASTSASSHSASPASSVPSELTPAVQVQRTELVQGLTWEDTFARQLYTEGTPCDVGIRKSRPRQTEVRFLCDQSTPHAPPAGPAGAGPTPAAAVGPQPTLVSVNEVSTCEYLAVVSVPALCRHPRFSPALPTVHEIRCTEVQPKRKDRRRTAREQRRNRLEQQQQDEQEEGDQQGVQQHSLLAHDAGDDVDEDDHEQEDAD